MFGLPLFFKLKNRSVVLIGDTEAAHAKLRLLLKTPARILWFVENAETAYADFSGIMGLDIVRRSITVDDLRTSALVYCATGDDEKDRLVSRLARTACVPVNIVDRPDLSDFSTPAIVDRSPLIVAISTHGAAPVLARRLRSAIERLLPSGIGHLIKRTGLFRGRLPDILPEQTARRRFWDRIFDLTDPQALLKLDDDTFNAHLEELAEEARHGDRAGFVQLVGAGPGDPDLLTLKAHKALQRADVILYDTLVGRDILDYARRDAVMIHVGKMRGNHGRGQAHIHDLMIRHARAGRHVVRLKGGDPLIFGRVGEEIAALEAHGVAYDVIPGISALSGSAAGAGMPLTHRDDASILSLVTGHQKDGSTPDTSPHWRGLAGAGRTLAVYMGVSKAKALADDLLADGLSPDFPVLVIENGTRVNERRFTGRLADLPALMTRENVKSPALILIGTVTRFAKKKAVPIVYESRPEVPRIMEGVV